LKQILLILPIYTVAKCLKELIVNKNIDEALERIIEWLSESLDIDRCYIFDHCPDTGSQTLFKSFRHGNEEGVRGDSIRNAQTSALSTQITFPSLKMYLSEKVS
jgi:hypothetical protein